MRSLLLSFSMVALGAGGSLVMAQGAAGAGLTNRDGAVAGGGAGGAFDGGGGAGWG